MNTASYCSIALLRPKETSLEELYKEQDDVMSDTMYSERLGLLVDYVRSLIEEAADLLRIRTTITEYQLFSRSKNRVVARNRAANILSEPLIVLTDPDETEINFADTGINRHPLNRGLLATTTRETFDRCLHVLGHKRIPTFDTSANGISFGKIRRFFSLRTSFNEDEQANLHQQNLLVAQSALSYPHIPEAEAGCKEFTKLQFPEED